MGKTEILYEPLPIARIGVRKSNKQVIVAKDFSCFAQMLEEYISLGVSNIVIPNSSPEIAFLEQMPIPLTKRVKIINDERELEIVFRLLHNLRTEFNVKIDNKTNHLSFSKGESIDVIKNIEQVHSDFKRMAVGFNHQIQVPVNINRAMAALHYLRPKVFNAIGRLILAEFEGILNQYQTIEYGAIQSTAQEAPLDLINIFDKLINDLDYIDYSTSIYDLSDPSKRQRALGKINELIRIIKSKSYFAMGWDYMAKIINVWAGHLIPNSKTIASLVTSDNLPVLIDLEPARIKAIQLWKNLKLTDMPLGRDGQPYFNEDMIWMPPSTGIEMQAPDSRVMSLGSTKELLKILNDFIGDGKD